MNSITKEIYIIRHGQTENNEKGILQGRGVNGSINKKGKQQAALFFEAYQQIAFDKIFVSALKRSRESVAAFIEKGIACESTTALDEISWGDLEGLLLDPAQKNTLNEVIYQWQHGNYSAKIANGESIADVQTRQLPFIEKLKNETANKILVCMHGRAMRALLCSLVGKPLSQIDAFLHTNLCLYKVVLKENSIFEIVIHNNIDHLKNEKTAV